MAINALQSASSALSAFNTALDVVANNLANINTVGFKADRTNFQDLLYIEKSQPGVENANGDQRPIGLYVGLGVKVSGTQKSFEQGAPTVTSNELDLAIEGSGFFKVKVEPEKGGTAYTRAGNFTLNSNRELVLANDVGRRLEPAISIPDNATKISIAADGQMFASIPGETEPQAIGQLELATFVNPAGLESLGENLFMETAASGAPVSGNPGSDSRGTLKQGMLEESNVDPTRELIELIRTQRAFEFNSQSIRAADEALKSVAQLRN